MGKGRGGGLIGVEECVKEDCKSLHGYLKNSTEWMLQMVLKEKVLVEEESLQDYKEEKEETLGNWSEKALHGEFARQTSDLA